MVNARVVTVLFILFASVSYGQDVALKNDIFTIDGQRFGEIEDDKSMPGCFYINDTTRTKLLYFKWVAVDDLNYFEIYKANDLGLLLFEQLAGTGFKKYMVKKLFNAQVLTGSAVDDQKLSDLAQKMGKEFSRIREERKR